MTLKHKLEQAAAELLLAKQTHEKAQAKWDELCAQAGIDNAENPEYEQPAGLAEWQAAHPQGNCER